MTQFNYETARHNMVEQQVRPWDVLDQKVLETLDAVPRDRFVDEAYRHLAYADTEIPLNETAAMMAPVVEGRMLQALDLKPEDRVLEIGTGSGYITACMAHLVSHVDSIEINPVLSQKAASRLLDFGVRNVTLHVADALADAPRAQTYDVIAVTGAVSEIPDTFKQALKPDGRLFVIRGEAPVMQAVLMTRAGDSTWNEQILFETCLKPLINAETKPHFVF